eukprot:scaffold3946_cov41-Cyclotella_meneghiniana.AAC.2
MGADDGFEEGCEPGKRVRRDEDVCVLGVHDRARKRRKKEKEKEKSVSIASRDGVKSSNKASSIASNLASNKARNEEKISIASKRGRPKIAEGRLKPAVNENSNEASTESEERSIASNGGRPSTAEGRLRVDEGERLAEGPMGVELGEVPAGLAEGPKGETLGESTWAGMDPPRLASGARINGQNKKQHRRENKRKRISKQEQQLEQSYWTKYEGKFRMPEQKQGVEEWKGGMCPQGLALHHPSAGALLQYATQGCPCNTGKDWTKEQIWAAVQRGPHVSSLEPDAIEQMELEIAEKEKQVRLKNEEGKQIEVPSVNDSTNLEAPSGAINQLGHSLERIIHAFAEAPEDAKIFMAKFDIKDGFWRLNAEQGYEWNFAYVLPQREGEPTKLVVPLSLQMGWVESPPYFCAASETARDVAAQYTELPVGTQKDNKFIEYAMGNEAVKNLPEHDESDLRYFIDVYVDDFLSLAIATSRQQIRHCANGVMNGIHDVFLEEKKPENDPILLKKLKKDEGQYALLKDMLGFEFDGEEKTMILEEAKRGLLLHKWIRTASRKTAGIEFTEFESVIYKIRHCFRSIPAGKGLLTPCNRVIAKRPSRVFLHRNERLTTALRDMRTIIREATAEPTKCRELVMGPPDFVGVQDASIYRMGAVIIGEEKACIPTVFRVEWPQWVQQEVLKTKSCARSTTSENPNPMRPKRAITQRGVPRKEKEEEEEAGAQEQPVDLAASGKAFAQGLLPE